MGPWIFSVSNNGFAVTIQRLTAMTGVGPASNIMMSSRVAGSFLISSTVLDNKKDASSMTCYLEAILKGKTIWGKTIVIKLF
jgi:hypothetical protein